MKIPAFLSILLLAGCVGDFDQNVEEAKFLLDRGEFSAAVAKAREAVAEKPESLEARFLLASALLGDAALTTSSRCANPADTGYLGLLACLQDEKREGESAFVTFTRIAPTVADKVASLAEARDLLIALLPSSSGSQLRNTYLQLWVARHFEIASVTTRIALCTSAFNAAALTSEELTRFQENLASVNGDGRNAGLSDSLSLNERVTTIGTELASAIANAGGDASAGSAAFFNAQNGQCL
jgi:hypothetical protein